MAKKKPAGDLQSFREKMDAAPNGGGESVELNERVEAPAPPEPKDEPKRYRVTLSCPTPLRDQSLIVEADGENEAKAKFCLHNGISDSDHPWSVVLV